MIFKNLSLYIEKDFEEKFTAASLPLGATLKAQFTAADKRWEYPVTAKGHTAVIAVPKSDIAQMADSLANRFGSWFLISRVGDAVVVEISGNFAVTTILRGKQ